MSLLERQKSPSLKQTGKNPPSDYSLRVIARQKARDEEWTAIRMENMRKIWREP